MSNNGQSLRKQFAENGSEVTLSDVTEYDARGFHVNVGGTVTVEMFGETVLPLVVTAGQSYPYRIKRFLATGSDAVEIVAFSGPKVS